VIGALFVNPLQFSSAIVPWLIIPLCLSVAVVYRTVRTDDVRLLPMQIAKLTLYIIFALAALSAVFVVVQHVFL
jgi:hypothetical protein